MRHLDVLIRHLGHERRSLRKRIAHAHRSTARLREHTAAIDTAMATARSRSQTAAAVLDRLRPTDAVPGITAAGPSAMDPPFTPTDRAAALGPDRDPALPGPAFERPAALDSAVAEAEARVHAAETNLKGLEREQRRLERRSRHYERVLRRLGRGAAGVRHRTANAERALAGTESALGYEIVVMTRLAQARAAKKTKHGPAKSGFGWPTHGQMTQAYGCTGSAFEPRVGSCAHFHDGIDIAGASGTPIRAAATGVVAYVGWNPWDQEGRAYIVVVAHPGGFVTRYGHLLPRSELTLGRLVHKGQLIGYMGSTGNSTGPHLHFEVLRGGTTVNPLANL
jgi:murein DD-endopeptidase MepM/ murein hydrolase activator NlpD